MSVPRQPGATPAPETRASIGDLAERLLDAGSAILALLDELDGDSDDEEDDAPGSEEDLAE